MRQRLRQNIMIGAAKVEGVKWPEGAAVNGAAGSEAYTPDHQQGESHNGMTRDIGIRSSLSILNKYLCLGSSDLRLIFMCLFALFLGIRIREIRYTDKNTQGPCPCDWNNRANLIIFIPLCLYDTRNP